MTDRRGRYFVRVKIGRAYSCFAIIGPGHGARHTARKIAAYLEAHPSTPGPVVVHDCRDLNRSAGGRYHATAQARAAKQAAEEWTGSLAIAKACRPSWARCSIMASPY